MNDHIDIQQHIMTDSRWRAIVVLHSGRPHACSESLIFSVLQDIHKEVSAARVRRILEYLEKKELIEITGKRGPMWMAELTAAGIDFYDHTGDDIPGIGRPKKWA